MGQPVGSQTLIARTFNQNFSGKQVNFIDGYRCAQPILRELVRLPSRDIHITEGMVQLMYAEKGGK